MIHLISAWRRQQPIDSAYLNHVRRYACQVKTLQLLTAVHVNVIHGDSISGLSTVLQGVLNSMDIMTSAYRYDHGKPDHGSSENPERLTALSGLLNFALEVHRERLRPDDTVIWVESDLYWNGLDMVQLHRFLQRAPVDIVAPMVMAGEAFYDVWGFRTTDGRRWGPFWPWGDIQDFTDPKPLVEMGSVGSCVAMTANVAKNIRVLNNNALVGWCHEARRHNYRIWCAKDVRIQHPFDWR